MGKINNIVKYSTRTVGIAFVSTFLYTLSLGGVQYVLNSMSPRIETQSQLEQLLKTEREKINPDDKSKINVYLEAYSTARCGIKDNQYGILIGGSQATYSTLKHELYHILDGHLIDMKEHKSVFVKELKTLFIYEPQATLYDAFDWKL